jgi:hypothetical protein
LTIKPQVGISVTLDAANSYDPDNNSLSFKWWVMQAAGTYSSTVSIANASSKSCSIDIPVNSAGKTIHIICEVKDNGTPNLTSYRRIIIEPTDKPVSINRPQQKQFEFSVENKSAIFYDLKGRSLTRNGNPVKTHGAVICFDHNSKEIRLIVK